METQRIALFGATSKVGERILKEALSRGHKVTAIVHDPKKVTTMHPNLKVVPGDIMNKNDIGSKIKGHDVVISAYEAKSPTDHITSTRALIEAVRNDNIRHLITTGHPGSSEVEPTIALPANAEAWKSVAEAQKKVLEEFDNLSNVNWSYLHYPEIQGALGKSGKPVLGNEMLVKNQGSEQRFPTVEYPQIVLDEVEHFTEAHTEL